MDDLVYVTQTGDAILRAFDGMLIVAERLGADTITALDVTDPATVLWQLTLPERANVHDVVRFEGELWASSYAHSEVYRIAPDSGDLLGTVDLSELADTDGIAELDRLVVHDGGLWVAAQQLDRSQSPWGAAGGVLARVDRSGVLERHETGPNPRIIGTSRGILVADGLFVPPGGGMPERASDGAIRRFTTRFEEPLFEERGRDIFAMVATESHAVVLTVAEDASSGVVCIDLASGEVTDGPSDSGWFYTAAVVGGDVLLGLRADVEGGVPGGVQRFDPATCTALSAPTCTVLDPYDLTGL